jgi:hypothetical protein
MNQAPRRGWIGGIIGTIGVLLLLVAVGWLAYWTGLHQRDTTKTPEGTNPSTNTPSEEKANLAEYRSLKGIMIRLDPRIASETQVSPLKITGEVPGNWSFEASFPIELRDSTDKVLSRAVATLQGDWMMTDLVPFTATLTFTEPATVETAQLVLNKDNPSDLPEHDDSVTIPVKLGASK